MKTFLNIKRIFLFVILIISSTISRCQIYKYIGLEDGLNNQKIYHIQKDRRGYMWFLTQEGVDRYDGKQIKHYNFSDDNMKLDSRIALNWFYMDNEDILWVIGQKGRIFKYDSQHDKFELVYIHPELIRNKSQAFLNYGYLDKNNRIWLCSKDSIVWYDTRTGTASHIATPVNSEITVIEQTDGNHFFIGTGNGLFRTQTERETLKLIPDEVAESIGTPVHELYYHTVSKQLFIGNYKEGILVYDIGGKGNIIPCQSPNNVEFNQIVALNDHELLIATGGKGVYKLDLNTYMSEPYITADYSSYNGMNGNNINDIYVDEEQRIWLANYPTGITIRNNRYGSYDLIKHSIGNSHSLVNNQVHDIMEDSDGDLWFATSNGISLYQTDIKEWHSFFSSFDSVPDDENHIFLALCEASPGVIWAGGFTSDIYKIEKKKGFKISYLSPATIAGIRPDQYIFDIKKDSDGDIWSGGYYHLKCINLETKNVRLYPGVSSITTIQEKDAQQMWIGTQMGLYQLDKKSGDYRYVDLPVESPYICALYQRDDSILYIGTRGSGLLVYNLYKEKFIHQYRTDNCALISNNIYTIIPRQDGNLLMGTEDGITIYSPKGHFFRNWTREQGLMSVNFNAGSATTYGKNSLVFGGNDGAVRFPIDIQIPEPHYSRLLLRDFMIAYHPVYPGDDGSPLQKDIDETDRLELAYEQNTFSLNVASINYDYPSNILFSWKIDGFHKEWSRPSQDNRIIVRNLPPGSYTLQIRAISNEEKYKTYETRNIQIVITPPAWASVWAMIGYAILLVLVTGIIFRIIMLHKQKKISDEKTRFFINTAHDIRTPLTLIKAPLEEVVENQMVTEQALPHMNMALKNVNNLLQLTTNLINFERIDVYSSTLYVSEYELNSYMNNVCATFRKYAEMKHVRFVYESNFDYLNVWFDSDKMGSILKNILSNALKYTPEGGNVCIYACEGENSWSIEVKDTGIGIPSCEQKKLFRNYFRGSNVINLKVTGSGIGLMLVYKLVRLHKGKIQIQSTEHQGTCVQVTFPKGNSHLHKAKFLSPQAPDRYSEAIMPHDTSELSASMEISQTNNSLQRILIVEDNDDLRNYLVNMFKTGYNVQSCPNGKEALVIMREFNPAIIISDIMMPEMGGDEFCSVIKNDLEMSHIPIILLTALGDEKNMLEGLEIGADAYITKPFSVGILKATVKNILANRALLRQVYNSIEDKEQNLPTNCTNNLDWKFIASVKECIKNNMENADFNVDMLSSLHHMSRTSFFNKLKALTGYAPADYIRMIRLQHAAQLLKQNKYTITEIADMVGFSDAKYFREVFKKYYNVSPSKFNKQQEEPVDGTNSSPQ
ncbi:hybrid sensor histidine kinase/response regulator transcription factor [Bacteroides muris (ex Fokt et al. 2023)]|uniref:histidine kinase n=1 Tax=Bacteroides muris (ex Fokt et al. 2023) TaxID=2937417 RepID=A0A9X2SQ76_9BACE|nr:two-component regulator propeller domain-containing protein [Bacteroides muris (ex Fokt et al. 2023)]MCR6503204.1 response regulator [Bacteroides muris (ex Fokt et al. 2023)]